LDSCKEKGPRQNEHKLEEERFPDFENVLQDNKRHLTGKLLPLCREMPNFIHRKEREMRKVRAAVLCLLTFATVFPALPAKAAPSALSAAAQSDCTALNVSKGEEKFAGQISGRPTGSLIEVTYGDQTVLVRYSDSVPVCEGGQPSAVNALALGENVVVYGPMKHKGKTLEMVASRILIAGRPQGGMRGGEPMNTSNIGMTQGGMNPVRSNAGTGSSQGSGSVAAKDDWNSGAGGSTNSQSSGASQGSGSVAGKDDWQEGSTGNMKGSSNTKSSGTISCSALVFTVNAHDEHTGQASGRSSVSGITCKKSVDQQTLQMTQDALTDRRLASVTLNWQNQMEVLLSNAEISSVQFTSDNGAQVVEVTFAYQRAEVVHLPSGTRITF